MSQSLVARQFNQPVIVFNQSLQPRIAITLYTPTGTGTICTDVNAPIDTGAVASGITQKFVHTHKFTNYTITDTSTLYWVAKHITATATHCFSTVVVLAGSEAIKPQFVLHKSIDTCG